MNMTIAPVANQSANSKSIETNLQKIVVVGCGYIGLPTAAMFASCGIHVLGVDINPRIIELINAGKIHIVEPELDQLVKQVVSSGFLRAGSCVEPADAFLITVPTPFKQDHIPDLTHVEMAVTSIAPLLKKNNLIVLESTAPVGTTDAITQQLMDLRPDLKMPDISIAYCPERVMPGQIMHELIHNDRIIGGITPACTARALNLYRLFVKGECIPTDARTAEMVKLAENAFRDVNIAYANELSMICDRLNIDVGQLIELANRHPRVNILQPGIGVGGHCIAVDPWFMVHAAPKEAHLIRTARSVNQMKPRHVVNKIKQAVQAGSYTTIACLGLTYKANSDDLRESPALLILEMLMKETTLKILVVEPHIASLPNSLLELAEEENRDNHARIKLVDLDHALAKAEFVVELVKHQAFKKPELFPDANSEVSTHIF